MNVLIGNMWNLLFLLIASAITGTSSPDYNIDHFLQMAERQKHLVLNTWKVEHAWVNPSMIHDPVNDSKVIMVWRMPDKGRRDKIGYMWLDFPGLNIIKPKDMIEHVSPGVFRTPLVGEDARIFNHNGKLFVVYNTHLTKYKRLYYTEVHFNASDDIFFTYDPPIHVTYYGEVNVRHQKNWTPFDYCPKCVYRYGSVNPTLSLSSSGTQLQPSLLFIYTMQPHTVVQTYTTNTTGEEVAEKVFSTELLKEYEWKWGEMRGGSPALLIDEHRYLAFFHSSGRISHKHIITYVMGAYMFDRNPPFAITHMSPEPIMHESFVNVTYGWSYRIVDYIVFPMGFTFDADRVYVSYGKNDRDSWMLTLNKTELLASMQPVKTRILGVSKFSDDSDGTSRIFRNTYEVQGNVTSAEGVTAFGTGGGHVGVGGKHHNVRHHLESGEKR